jgi:serine protease Do
MHLQNLDPELAHFFHLATADGVLISFVDVGSQAEQHGLRRGDVITSMDGQSIKTLQDLLDMLKHKKPGQEFVFLVTRDQRPLRIRLPFTAPE